MSKAVIYCRVGTEDQEAKGYMLTKSEKPSIKSRAFCLTKRLLPLDKHRYYNMGVGK